LKLTYFSRSTDYLGAAIASVVIRPPNDVKGKTYSAVQLNASGREMVEIFTKIHNGQQTKIIDFTETDLQHLLNDGQGFGVALAGYRESWDLDEWDFEPPIEVEGYRTEGLSEIIQRYL
jgi:hypothetical protein